MKKLHLVKGIATAMLAIALAVGVAVPVEAAKVSQGDIKQTGAIAAPTIKLEKTELVGQVTHSWTFTTSAIPKDCRLYFNVYDEPGKGVKYEDARINSATLDWQKDSKGRYYFNPNPWWGGLEPGENERTFYNYQFTLGKKVVEAYLFDSVAYDKACDAADAAADAAYDKAYDAYNAERDRIWAEWNKKYENVPWNQRPEIEYPESPDWSDYYNEPYYMDYMKVSKPVSISVIKRAYCSTKLSSDYVQIKMRSDDKTTGYEIYRKVGSKYKKIARVAKDVYKDSGLVSKTTYTYKVRPYYYNKRTKVTSYGAYTEFDAVTMGSALKLKASISGSKSVKLSWSKVPGAVRYEIYRSVASSYDTSISKGEGNGYSLGKLIKTAKKSSKSYTDKKTSYDRSYHYTVKAVLSGGTKVDVSESIWVDLGFGAPDEVAEYRDKYGNVTVKWRKVPGADGYIVEKKIENPTTGDSEWMKVGKTLSKSTTSKKFTAPKPTKDKDGYWNTVDEYRIKAYKKKNNAVSEGALYVDASAVLAPVDGVTAKKTTDGIKVSWKPVKGASYYRVYRMREGAVVKNSDTGCYVPDNAYDNWTSVTEYVGLTDPKTVDVAKWNADRKAEWEAYRKNPNTVKQPIIDEWRTLNEDETYYYQNYKYAQNIFTGTSMTDYSAEVYSASLDYQGEWVNGDFKTYGAAAIPNAVNERRDYHVGPEDGVSYQYYVVAYMDEEYTKAEYGTDYDEDIKRAEVTPGSTTVTFGKQKLWKYNDDDGIIQSIGCKKVPSITWLSSSAPKTPSIKSLKAGKKKVTVYIKKTSGANEYIIYRSTKKKGPFKYVGRTSGTKYTDSGLKKGTKYYYKVVAVKASGTKSDIKSKSSKVKSITAK